MFLIVLVLIVYWYDFIFGDIWASGPDSRNDQLAIDSDTILWSWSADRIPQTPITIGSFVRENTKPNILLPIKSWCKSFTGNIRIEITWSWLNEIRQTDDIYSWGHNGRCGDVIKSEYIEYEYTGWYWNIHCLLSQTVPSKMMALRHNGYLQKSWQRSMPSIDGMICMNFKSTFVIDTHQEIIPSSGEHFPVAIIVATNGIDRNSLWSALHANFSSFVLVNVPSYWTIIGVRFGLVCSMLIVCKR